MSTRPQRRLLIPMPLWLYALTTSPLPAAAPRGAAGEPLAAWPIPAGDGTPSPAERADRAAPEAPATAAPAGTGLYVVAGEVPAPLRPEEATLRAHERTVRALAAALDPLLPIRFGQTVAAPDDLLPLLSPRRAALLAALAQVAGCHQFTLRFPSPDPEGLSERSEAPPSPAEPRSERSPRAAPGPGTRYLQARRHAATAAATPPPHARPLLARLAPHVRAERLGPARPPYAATVYHLVEHTRLDAYLAALAEAAAAGAPPPTSSGPWPAWAFAPGLAD